MSTIHPPVRLSFEEEGSLARIILNRPKGNVLDAAMVEAVRGAIREISAQERCCTILFEGQGAHFSYGASVEEHRKDEAESMLSRFHALFLELSASRRVCLAAVRGFVLGGGLELAAYCHRVFAAQDAKMGCPEISLGVFAPLASIVLPRRAGQARADDLLLSGRTVSADEALAIGLADAVSADPAAAAIAWHREQLQQKSAAALRCAVAAARWEFDRALSAQLPALERFYVSELMETQDAGEGIEAFLQKRKATWVHR
ncbi:MAG: enoyl-CoA hydratase/isomerase family protein [Planctomycetes bacterium]|nr:enoyl-CoA hydratase/isomerase family protein [Planctomycetota bacterium]